MYINKIINKCVPNVIKMVYLNEVNKVSLQKKNKTAVKIKFFSNKKKQDNNKELLKEMYIIFSEMIIIDYLLYSIYYIRRKYWNCESFQLQILMDLHALGCTVLIKFDFFQTAFQKPHQWIFFNCNFSSAKKQQQQQKIMLIW